MPETAKKTTAKAAPKADQTVWDLLAAPFPQEDLERLPKALRSGDNDKGRCEDTNSGRRYSADDHYCTGWHARSVHLDYVGHAGITTRLNTVLGPMGWDLQPMARTVEGLPFMARGEFWAVLTITVDDVTVAKADLAANYNSTQEAWGDALRRTAMRFGVGTYLWSKSEAALALKRATDDAPEPERQDPPPQVQQTPPPQAAPAQPPAHVKPLLARLGTLGVEDTTTVREWWAEQELPMAAALDQYQVASVISFLNEKGLAVQDPT